MNSFCLEIMKVVRWRYLWLAISGHCMRTADLNTSSIELINLQVGCSVVCCCFCCVAWIEFCRIGKFWNFRRNFSSQQNARHPNIRSKRINLLFVRQARWIWIFLSAISVWRFCYGHSAKCHRHTLDAAYECCQAFINCYSRSAPRAFKSFDAVRTTDNCLPRICRITCARC